VTEHGPTPIGGSAAPNRFTPVRRGHVQQPASGDQPPAALQAEYQAAAKVIENLASQQVNLHFEVDDANRVHVQVMDSDGKVIREIPARSMLDMLSGGGLLIDDHA
jgi:uncharacterized FlaG/YvyC family protein